VGLCGVLRRMLVEEVIHCCVGVRLYEGVRESCWRNRGIYAQTLYLRFNLSVSLGTGRKR